MLRTINLLAFGVGGSGFENFENLVTAATGLSCNPHRISSQCTSACESGLVSVQSALNTKPSLDMSVQTTPLSPRKCTPSLNELTKNQGRHKALQIIFEMKSSTARQSDFEIEITYLEQLQLICEGKLS